MSMSESCYPGCPYAYHYIMEALLKCGMDNEAKKLLMDYWGGMVKKGADTFGKYMILIMINCHLMDSIQ